VYLPEFISYLRDSFGIASRGISIKYAVDKVKLDISQAIPVGIILNEAITNAIKYAFPGNKQGEILITLNAIDDEHVVLKIADNGIGLPQNFNEKKITSLGMTLIKGLSLQLEGGLEIENSNGLTISIAFKIDSMPGIGKEEAYSSSAS